MRELSDETVKYQAEALISYLCRGGTPDRWWNGKDFGDEDRDRIVAEAARQRGAVFS